MMLQVERVNTNETFPLGMAYVPWQKIDKVYEDLSVALCEGTLFPELNKPYTGGKECPK